MSMMVIHNIYIINGEGLCPLNLKLGSIEANSDLVAGIFAATQKLWEEITGETPKIISFKDMNAYIKSFSIEKKGWYLILVTDKEKMMLVEKVQDYILKIVEENNELFKNFFADTTDITSTMSELITNKLSQISCPHAKKKSIEDVCEIDYKPIVGLNCNIVSMSSCQTKIRDYQTKNLS
ncbi:MAG: hypothetical protein WED07_02730 [Candidatus Freyarchaeum deiterrae]